MTATGLTRSAAPARRSGHSGRGMTRQGWLLFAAVGVIWGIPYALIEIADRGVSVPVLVFARVFIGALVLLPVAVRRGRLAELRARWRWIVALSAVEVMLPWLLLSAAERQLSSSLSGLLIAVVPVLGVGAARLAGDRERLTRSRWAGLLIGIGGVLLLMRPAAAAGNTIPVLEVLGTAACYATGPVIADRKLAGADGLDVTAACLGLAALVYAAPAALTWPHSVPAADVLGALAGLALICTALAFVLYFRLIAEVGAVRATVITYVNPAVAVAMGAAVLGEPVTPLMVISFGLILAGSVLATLRGARGAEIDWDQRAPCPYDRTHAEL
jgi:drug/metabolite transporter (DMT)-like permease